MSQFTKVYTELAQRHGLIAAAIYGAMEYYSKMDSGKCTASLSTLGKKLGLTAPTVMRHVVILENAGLLTDETPTLKRHPHTYKINELVLQDEIPDEKAITESNTSITDSNTVLQDETLYYTESVKEKEVKRKEEEISLSVLFKLMESATGRPIDQKSAELMADDVQAFGLVDVMTAISEMKRRGKRNYSYAAAILKNGGVKPNAAAAPKKRTWMQEVQNGK